MSQPTVYYPIDAHIQHPHITTTFCPNSWNNYILLNSICRHDVMVGNYRSVVLDQSTLDVYSVSPPTSVTTDEFFKYIPTICLKEGRNIDHQRVLVNEWVEGTMVNLWYDSNADRWEISTKNAISGRDTYHRNHCFDDASPVFPGEISSEMHMMQMQGEHVGSKSFRDMFIEAVMVELSPAVLRTSDLSPPPPLPHLSNIIDGLGLSKFYSYSFVLQHPENHLVLPVESPCVYLVAVYHVPHNSLNNYLLSDDKKTMTTTTTMVQRIDHDIYEKWPEVRSIPRIRFPRVIPATTYSS
jgi:hypothetical protein